MAAIFTILIDRLPGADRARCYHAPLEAGARVGRPEASALSAGRQAPRGIVAGHSRVEEADAIAGRIAQVGLAPEPRLILRLRLEAEARGPELPDLRIQILDLEVHDDAVVNRNVRDAVQREGGVADGALEAGVVGGIADD